MVMIPALNGVHRKGPVGSGGGTMDGGWIALMACTIACAT